MTTTARTDGRTDSCSFDCDCSSSVGDNTAAQYICVREAVAADAGLYLPRPRPPAPVACCLCQVCTAHDDEDEAAAAGAASTAVRRAGIG